MASPQQALPAPTIDLLLNLIDTRPDAILASLSQHPHLASAADAHGYSLVHASVSYGQLGVLRDLIHRHKVNVNLLDEDGETPLFAAETVQVAKCLLEELGADQFVKNGEGKTAEDKFLDEDGEANQVYQYLKSRRTGDQPVSAGVVESEPLHPPPPLPDGVRVELGTMTEAAVGHVQDPEIRRRIEELAAREDFQTEQVQSQLRALVSEVVMSIGTEETARNVRRRVD